MINDYILENCQIRKSNKEKTIFIDYITTRLSHNGYPIDQDIHIESRWKGIFKTRNILVGNPDEAEIFITAHYDTCAVLPFPNFMAPTNPFLFILFQLFIACIIILITGGIGFAFALLFNNPAMAYPIFLITLWLLIFHTMFGLKNKHTANDNTSGVILITQILESLPPEHRHKVCAVYFDNEEKGLLGSSFFASKHKDVQKNKLLINFDCIGDGKHIVSMAKKKARINENYELFIQTLTASSEQHDIHYMNKNMKPMMFPSDQAHFDAGIGVCALKKSPLGLYCARIHTPFDTKCREQNISYLVSAMINFICKID